MRSPLFFIHYSLFRHGRRGSRGAISIPLILVLVIIVVFASLELGALVVSQTETSGSQTRSQAAFRAAESGAHDALKRLSRDFTYTCAAEDCYSVDAVIDGCTSGDGCAYVQVTGTGTASDPKIITSRGVSRGAERTIQVTAEFDTSLDGKIVSAEWTELLAGTSVNWASGWAYRKAITIQAAQVSGSANLANFPVLINTTDIDWRSSANGGNVAQDDGGDIRFTGSNGSTRLTHEIEHYNPATGELVAWVKVPSLDFDNNTTIYIYYGNGAGGLNQQDPENVWDSNYRMVLHLGEESGNAVYDSTANGKHGAKLSATEPAPAVGGQINGGQNFDGTGDRIEVTDPNLPTGDFTYSTWVDMTAVDDESLFMASDGTGANEFVIILHTQVDVISNNSTVLTTAGSIPTGNPTHLTVTRSSDLITVYIDGGADPNTANEGGAYSFSTCPLLIGTDADAAPCADSLGNYVSGIMDEVRVSDIARSPDWIQTEYNNQNSPGTFYSIGPEEQDADWPSGWAYRNKITIDNTQVAGTANHSNFPVLISRTDTDWRDTANGGDVAQADGGDIMFTSSDGIIQLSHEIESYDPATGQLIAWVKIPTLDFDTDTQIFMYYGNSSGGLDEQDAAGTWSGYNNVWHLHADENDSAGSADGTNVSTTNSVGKIADGQDLSGDATYVEWASSPFDGLSAYTFTFWVSPTGAGEPGFSRIVGNDNDDLELGDDVNLHIFERDLDATWRDTGLSVPDSTWTYFAVQQTGSGREVFKNGTSGWSDAVTGTLNIAGVMRLGSRYSNMTEESRVELDEVRITMSALSADWLTTEYNNQNSPGTFYSVGTQETP